MGYFYPLMLMINRNDKLYIVFSKCQIIVFVKEFEFRVNAKCSVDKEETENISSKAVDRTRA